MQLRRFDDPAGFSDHVRPFLLTHEAEHCLPLAIIATLMQTDIYEQSPYLACVEKDGAIVAVAVRTPPYNLVLSKMENLESLQFIAADIRELYSELRGVFGTKALSKAFAEIWHDLSGQSPRLNMHERVYRLERVCPVTEVDGQYGSPTEADRDLLTEWFMAFSSEATEPISREAAERQVNLRLKGNLGLHGLRLWLVDNKPASLAGYNGPTPNGIRIGPVYTPPELRGHGYASACVAMLSQEMLDKGRKFCFLFTDLSNSTSNHIYQNIGYEPVGDVDEYRFESKS